MKKISAISMSIVLILSIFSYASADNTPVKESDFNIVNKSNVQISAKSVENKGVTISDNIKADKSNALIVDSKSSIDIKKSLETEAYDILVVIDDTDKEKLHITWNGINKHDVFISGEAIIRVDINGYEEEKRASINKELIQHRLVVDAIKDSLDYINNNEQRNVTLTKNTKKKGGIVTVLHTVTNQNWSNVETSQVADYYAPYGITRNNYSFKKAHITNSGNDHFVTVGVQAQVNPGAQLCSGNPSYECKYQVERINTFAQSNNTAFPMIDHDPVNTGSSGSQSYSMGAETGTGGFTASASYSFSINWTSLTLTDNSNSYGYWTWTISNPLQSQVVTVDSGAVFVGPNTTDYIYASTTVNSSFDSWNTTPVTGLAQKSRVVSW